MRSPLSTVMLILMVSVVGCVFYIRCYNQELMYDEVLYEYVWEGDDDVRLWHDGHRFERKVENFNDILTSQIQHYKHANGRSLIHAGEQAFAERKTAFSIVNTCIFLLFILLTGLLCIPRERRYCFVPWLVIFLIFLLFSPDKDEWISPNLAPNYLWPSVLSLASILVWYRLAAGKLKPYCYPLVVLLGFVTGWSHEAFMIGVVGGMALYYVFCYRRFTCRILWLWVPMAVGGLIMLASPGYYLRYMELNGSQASLFGKIATGLAVMSDVWIIWGLILLFLIIVCIRGRKFLRRFWAADGRMACVAMVSLCFTLVAHSAPRSLTAGYVFILCVFFSNLFECKALYSRWVLGGSLVVTVLFLAQQIAVGKDSVINYRYQHDLIERYRKSSDGIVEFREPQYPFYTRPYVKYWDQKLFSHDNIYFKDWNMAYSSGNKMPLFLDSTEYRVFSDPDRFFTEENLVEGGLPIYHSEGGLYYWVRPGEELGDVRLVGKLYPAEFGLPGSLLLKTGYLVAPSLFPDSELLTVDTVNSVQGKRYKIISPKSRKIRSIVKE